IYLDNPEALYLQRDSIGQVRLSGGDRTYVLTQPVAANLRDRLIKEDLIPGISPEDCLEYAIAMLPSNSLTVLLRTYGYQPIPTAKQSKRDKALSH
ncbi:MAG: hypothetical protein ACRC62_18455, partial [Microcoleus sp.]